MTTSGVSAFGVDHGNIEKAFNPLKMFRGAKAVGGKHAAASSSPMFDQLANKHGIAATSAGGGKRIATTPGKRRAVGRAKVFGARTGGARRA